MTKFRLLLILLFFVVAKPVPAQPFINEINAFKRQDSIAFPPLNAIVFVGSSSFAMWTTVQAAFPTYTIINRGFGGSTLLNVIYYAHDVITRYKPRQVVIYCGENDLASSGAVTPTIVAGRVKQLFQIIRDSLPSTKVTYVSMKPSPSRKHLMPKMEAANDLIVSVLRKYSNTSYVNLYNRMLYNGQPKPALFKSDSLHMTPLGYKLWTKLITPALLK